jgi:hypothetical protein
VEAQLQITRFVPYMSQVNKNRSGGKPHLYRFYICGFNFAIVAGLFVGFIGWLLGRWRGMLASFRGFTPGIALYAALAGASAGWYGRRSWAGWVCSRCRAARCCAPIRMAGSS